MLRHEVVMQVLRCFFPKGKHQPQAASFKQSARRILVGILSRLAIPTPQKVTVLLDSFRARVARERYTRERYAAYRHGRPIRVCRRPPAASNIDRAQRHAETAVLVCTATVATELRESVTRNKATLLVARVTASESVSIKRQPTSS
jgi:hypothetical protein